MAATLCECARGALLAVHAASGLAAGHSKEVTRLFRAAEGLLRTGVALIEANKTAAAPNADGPTPRAAARRRRAANRKKRDAAVPGADENGGGLVKDVGDANAVEEAGGAENTNGLMDVDGYMEKGELNELAAAPACGPSSRAGGTSSAVAAASPGAPRGSGRTRSAGTSAASQPSGSAKGGLGRVRPMASVAERFAMVKQSLAECEAVGSSALAAACRKELEVLGGLLNESS